MDVYFSERASISKSIISSRSLLTTSLKYYNSLSIFSPYLSSLFCKEMFVVLVFSLLCPDLFKLSLRDFLLFLYAHLATRGLRYTRPIRVSSLIFNSFLAGLSLSAADYFLICASTGAILLSNSLLATVLKISLREQYRPQMKKLFNWSSFNVDSYSNTYCRYFDNRSIF